MRPILLLSFWFLLCGGCGDPAPGADGIVYKDGNIKPLLRDGIGGVRLGAVYILQDKGASVPLNPEYGWRREEWNVKTQRNGQILTVSGHSLKVLEILERSDFRARKGSLDLWGTPSAET